MNLPGSFVEDCENFQVKVEEQKQPPRTCKSKGKRPLDNLILPKTKTQTGANKWTEEDDKKLFTLYKEKGSLWSLIAKKFEDKTESNVKNRFYSTLRRIARKKTKDMATSDRANEIKHNILGYVDDALEYGHTCFSKRGRPRKTDKHIPNFTDAIPLESKQEPVAEKEQDNVLDTAESQGDNEFPDFDFKLEQGYKELLGVGQPISSLNPFGNSVE